MKIVINNIPEEGLSHKFHKDSDWFRNLLPQKERSDFALQDVDVGCMIKRIRENVFIDGTLETVVTSSCCRCLDITQLPVKSIFRYTFVPAKDRDAEEEELTQEDLEYGYYEDDVIDLDTIIFEQIMLQIPIKVLCTDTCKGLCPHCGNNLNMVRCDCHKDFIDEKLAVLKNVKISDNK
ncbi:MAG: DUF177 domain-containing protein [Syntrophaceae bacterium]|nr:DUF177 domain-containing protein [Syntrophaceae bacterium]